MTQSLFPTFPARFDQVRPPRPLRSAARRDEYGLKWRALVSAAEAAGFTPADLAAVGVVGLNEARVRAGLPAWSDRTVAYYAKLVRYSGLCWDDLKVSDAGPAVSAVQARALWVPRGWTHPAAWRTAAVCAMAWLWPAPVTVWLALPAAAVRVSGGGVLVCGTELGDVFVPAGGEVWSQWCELLAGLGVRSSFALCSTARSRFSRPGDPLSLRAFEAAFARHAGHCGLAGLSYERYRVSAVADGAPVVGGRGAVRAARRTPVRSRRPDV